MTLRLYPLPSLYDTDVASVRAATPVDVSGFYLKRTFSVPWSALPTTFVFETDRPTDPHTFTINRTEQMTIVPGAATTSLQLQLKQGANSIDIETPAFSQRGLWSATSLYRRFDSVGYDGTAWVCLQENVGVTPEENAFWSLSATFSGEREVTSISVASTGIETWFRALGREVYLSAGKRQQEVISQLFSPWTTRISSHFISFSDLFLPARMPKLQQTRMAIITSIGRRLGYGDGVIQMASAVSYSTPWVTKPRNSEFDVPGLDYDYPYVSTSPTTAENKGRLLDIWSPNQCLATKLAVTQLALAIGSNDTPEPRPIRLVGFDDYQVFLSVNGGPTEVHYINPSAPECADIEFSTDCAGELRTFVDFEGVYDIFMNTPQLPFDMVVETPLLFGFWDEGNNLDMSEGSGSPGLGGGDDIFDTVDDDDPFGTGFAGISLSRRFDAPMCLDTRLQRGQRMVKYIPPVGGPFTLTPPPDLGQAGTPLKVDTVSVGAPPATIGTTTLWASSQQNFIYQGDYVRVESPDQELQVVSAWPVFDPVTSYILRDGAATVSTSAGEILVNVPVAGFFEQRYIGMGLRFIAGVITEYASIVRLVSDQTVVVAGNLSVPIGACDVVVYQPKRDPTVTNGAPFAGNRLYQVELSGPLPASLPDLSILDLRHAPLVQGAFPIGSSVIRIASDVVPLPMDKLFFTDSVSDVMLMATDTGLVHNTTGFKVYDVFLEVGTLSNLVDNQPLYAMVHNQCWLGDPVTPLRVLTLAPSGFIGP